MLCCEKYTIYSFRCNNHKKNYLQKTRRKLQLNTFRFIGYNGLIKRNKSKNTRLKEEKIMPNWIKNRITLRAPEQEKIEEMFDFFKGENGDLDFNKIIPIPEDIKGIEPDETSQAASAYYKAKELGNFEGVDELLRYKWCRDANITTREELLNFWESNNGEYKEIPYGENLYEYGKYLWELEQKYGCDCERKWRIKNWLSIWNAVDEKREENTMEFVTAVTGVPDLMIAASKKFPAVTVCYEFADMEYYGGNLGRYIFRAGEVFYEYEPEDDSEDAMILTKEILGDDFED